MCKLHAWCSTYVNALHLSKESSVKNPTPHHHLPEPTSPTSSRLLAGLPGASLSGLWVPRTHDQPLSSSSALLVFSPWSSLLRSFCHMTLSSNISFLEIAKVGLSYYPRIPTSTCHVLLLSHLFVPSGEYRLPQGEGDVRFVHQ